MWGGKKRGGRWPPRASRITFSERARTILCCSGMQTVTETRTSATDWLLLLVPAVIWGASFLFIAEALEAIGPNGVTFVRILVGFLTLAMFPSTRRPIERGDWKAVALLGFVWFAFPLSMFPHAEMRVSSALTGMLNGAVPLFTAIVASVLARRLPSRGILTGLAVGLSGVVMIALPTLGEGRSNGIGVLLIFVAVLSYGFALPIAQPLQKKYGALPVIWRAQAVALVLTAPLGLPEIPGAQWSAIPVLSLLALGALGTGIAFVMMTTAAGRLGATRASGAVFLTPGVALLLGVLVRGERVAWLSVIGCAVAVAGAWIMRRAQNSGAVVVIRSEPGVREMGDVVQDDGLRRTA
jgi:drug/metabolite transporter (DMT)-like permease